MPVTELHRATRHIYSLKNPTKAFVRDLGYLEQLQAITVTQVSEFEFLAAINLDWPTEITETEFFKRSKELPKGKVYGFFSN